MRSSRFTVEYIKKNYTFLASCSPSTTLERFKVALTDYTELTNPPPVIEVRGRQVQLTPLRHEAEQVRGLLGLSALGRVAVTVGLGEDWSAYTGPLQHFSIGGHILGDEPLSGPPPAKLKGLPPPIQTAGNFVLQQEAIYIRCAEETDRVLRVEIYRHNTMPEAAGYAMQLFNAITSREAWQNYGAAFELRDRPAQPLLTAAGGANARDVWLSDTRAPGLNEQAFSEPLVPLEFRGEDMGNQLTIIHLRRAVPDTFLLPKSRLEEVQRWLHETIGTVDTPHRYTHFIRRATTARGATTLTVEAHGRDTVWEMEGVLWSESYNQGDVAEFRVVQAPNEIVDLKAYCYWDELQPWYQAVLSAIRAIVEAANVPSMAHAPATYVPGPGALEGTGLGQALSASCEIADPRISVATFEEWLRGTVHLLSGGASGKPYKAGILVLGHVHGVDSGQAGGRTLLVGGTYRYKAIGDEETGYDTLRDLVTFEVQPRAGGEGIHLSMLCNDSGARQHFVELVGLLRGKWPAIGDAPSVELAITASGDVSGPPPAAHSAVDEVPSSSSPADISAGATFASLTLAEQIDQVHHWFYDDGATQGDIGYLIDRPRGWVIEFCKANKIEPKYPRGYGPNRRKV